MHFLNEYDILYFESIDSTHSFCRKILSGNLAVYAGFQLSGYGKRLRKWFSPAGNLYVSIVADLKIDTCDLNFFSLFVGCAVRDFLVSYVKNETVLKLHWPNDIYLDGKKLGGILLEIPTKDRCIISVGVNTNVLPDGCYGKFAALNIAKHKQELVKELISEIKKWYNKFTDNKRSVVDYWRKWLYISNADVAISCENRKIFGLIQGVSDDGRLLLKLANGDIKSFVSGDISSA